MYYCLLVKENVKVSICLSIVSGHSVRGASTSAAAGADVTVNEIMQAIDWSRVSVPKVLLPTFP